MPFPPPPPPGPPPPPSFTPVVHDAKPEERNMLLASIRQGTTLKKTVTNDRSSPLVAGKSSGCPVSGSVSLPTSRSSSTSPRINGPLNGSATLGRNNGLSGLFAGGMPKLKPTGLDIGQNTNTSQSLTSLPASVSANTKSEIGRRQFNIDVKNRGPPPQPPPANQKPTMPTSASDSVLTGPLHNRSNSTTSLNNTVLHNNNNNNNNSWSGGWTGGKTVKAPVGGYGKPNVAPKPPSIANNNKPSPPIKKLVNGRPAVTRAQSMRAPRSPPVAPPMQVPTYPLPNQSELYRVDGPPSFHQSQDSLLHTPPPPKAGTLPSSRVPANRPPLRPPQQRPPPPPPSRVAMNAPPPPPPMSAPPPPPSRGPPHSRLPPVPVSSLTPPPPPLRHSSMRNGIPQNFCSELEARFIEKFHVVHTFPPPQTFLGIPKVYNSKASQFSSGNTAKAHAPAPPPLHSHIQLRNWDNNSSSC